jgi:hypothetical protein
MTEGQPLPDADTPDQLAALRKVHTALEELNATLGEGVLTEWVLVSASLGFTAEGATQTAYRIHGMPTDLAPHRVAGLLAIGAAMGPG